MTDIQLRLAAINSAHTSNHQTQLEAATDIYEWLKEAQQPTPNPTFPQPAISYGDYTLFFDNDQIRFVKEGVDLSVGIDPDDLWDDLHQPAPDSLTDGDFLIRIEDGNLCILKKSARACFTPGLDGLWAELSQQDGQPAPGPKPIPPLWAEQERRGRGVAPLQDQAAAELHVRMPREGESVRIVYGPDSHKAGQTDIMRVSNVRYPKFTVSTKDHCYSRYIGDHGSTWCYRGELFDFEKEAKAAFAEAASQVAPATPQEDLEARRAHEPVESAPFAFRLELIDLIKKHRGIGPDGSIAWIKYSFIKAADHIWQTTWAIDSLSEAPAEPAKRVPEVGDLVSYSGGDAVVFNVAHLPHFSAIRVNCNSSTTVGLHTDGAGWSFKD